MPALILASRGRITNPFGAINPPHASVRRHQGVDTGHGNGLDVFAPAAGFASARSAGDRPGTYGRYWWINHDDGTRSLVAHLARHIGGNRRVEQGEVIGVMGNSGTIAVHCHQEYIDAFGRRVDPVAHLAAAGGGITPIDTRDEIDMATIEQLRSIVREEVRAARPQIELRREPNGTIWLVFDRVLRHRVENLPALERIQQHLKARGYSAEVTSTGSRPNDFGAPLLSAD